MSKNLFYDTHTGAYITSDMYGLPDRYIPIGCGPQGVYIDKWEDSNGQCLSIGYLANEYTPEIRNAKLQNMCALYNFQPRSLKMVMLPEEMFTVYMQTYGTSEDVAAYKAYEMQHFVDEYVFN